MLIIRQRPIWNSRLCLSFSVSAGGEVELRLIGAGGDYGVVVSVDDHSMRVVSSDGHNVLPVEVQKLILMPGERYDVRVRGNQAPDSYWIRARVLGQDGEADKIDGTWKKTQSYLTILLTARLSDLSGSTAVDTRACFQEF